jgi:magnesium transporter
VHIEALRIVGDSVERLSGIDVDAAVALVQSDEFVWLDLNISDANYARLYKLLVERLEFHPATYSDCVQPTPFHQPKLDEDHDYRFISFIYYAGTIDSGLTPRELNIYAGQTYVITVHREPLPTLFNVLAALPPHIVRYEEKNVLFLQHVLDVMIDSYQPILATLEQRCDELELAVLSEQPAGRQERARKIGVREQLADMRHILRSRQALVLLRRTLSAEQGILQRLVGEYDFDGADETSLEIAIYFRDVADHVAKYLVIIETEERSLNHMMEVHHLITNNRTNEIIYILTIMSTIMLPLNLIVGFFGMNHDDLWLIHHPHGVWIVAGIMLAVTLVLIYYFRTRRWI